MGLADLFLMFWPHDLNAHQRPAAGRTITIERLRDSSSYRRLCSTVSPGHGHNFAKPETVIRLVLLRGRAWRLDFALVQP
jgi:hypothetical protein